MLNNAPFGDCVIVPLLATALQAGAVAIGTAQSPQTSGCDCFFFVSPQGKGSLEHERFQPNFSSSRRFSSRFRILPIVVLAKSSIVLYVKWARGYNGHSRTSLGEMILREPGIWWPPIRKF